MPVSSTNGSTKKPFQRLPSDVIPIHYDIYLRPNLVDLVFKGSLKVELDVKKATDTLICNAAEMTVDEIKINDEPIAESKISEEDETLTMKLSKALEPGTKAILSCKFTGELNDKMRGFYRYFYTSSIISSNFWLWQCQEDLTLNYHTEIFYVLQ